MHHKHPHLIHQNYRPDIDGLRAVAVLSVVAYHFSPLTLPGGFVGVDIFFVISGFLISTIIFSSLERERFSLFQFYVRRIRRIFPALILVLASCLALGRFVLFSEEYQELGKHVAASAGFVQNFSLLGESGYFDNKAVTKPLLHLWSLAIEEQFYMFWPLLLAFVWKRNWNFLKITAIVAVLSFTANVYLIHRNPSSAFYLPVSRFWELMAGSVLAYLAMHRPALIQQYQNTQSVFGFALILLGLAFLDKETIFPGWWALFPTLGAFLIISAGQNAWLNQKLLANRILVWIGLISYPVYLWHWPLLTFLRIEEGFPSRIERVAAVFIAFVLSWLTYRFVEKPLRFGGNPNVKAGALLALMSLLLFSGILCYQSREPFRLKHDGRYEYLAYFENSLPEWKYFAKTNMEQHYRADCDFYDLDKYRMGHATNIPRKSINESCYVRDPRFRHSLLIWGDSHGEMLYYGLKNRLPADWQILMGTSSGCRPNPNISLPSTTQYCDQSNWFALNTIAQAKPDVVIVAQESGHSLRNMNEIIVKLRHLGVKRIIFTGPSPHCKQALPYLIARRWFDNTPKRTFSGIDQSIIDLNNQLKSGFKHQNDVAFISLIDFFCNNDGCLTYIGGDKKQGITTWDYGHLTPIASDLLAKQLLVGEIKSGFDDTNRAASSARGTKPSR